MTLKRVVVTGIGAISPLGNNVSDFWTGVTSGMSGAGPITLFDTHLFKTKFACEVKNYHQENYFDRKEVKKLDRCTQFGLIAVDEAVKDSGMEHSAINKDRVGAIWATGIGGFETFENELIQFVRGNEVPRFSPFFIVKMIANMVAGLITIKYGFTGMSYVTVSACASSNNSIIDAYNYIRLAKADIIVAGGSEAPITRASIGGFNSMKAMSERNNDPGTASRPFDKDRDGFVMAEGGASLILEELEHAKARGAKIYAEMVGGGLSSDAYHVTSTHPQGLGALKAMKEALEEANLTPSEVDYLNLHATSTLQGDRSELYAVNTLFGENPKLNLSATKSMTGHLLGGAGAIEAVAVLLAMKNSLIPPTINLQELDSEISKKLNLTLYTAQKREVKVGMSNTFGFGGHNTTVVFKKFED
jgi:3-oxoacyl-[acyl-carrier-protein] synthase II